MSTSPMVGSRFTPGSTAAGPEPATGPDHPRHGLSDDDATRSRSGIPTGTGALYGGPGPDADDEDPDESVGTPGDADDQDDDSTDHHQPLLGPGVLISAAAMVVAGLVILVVASGIRPHTGEDPVAAQASRIAALTSHTRATRRTIDTLPTVTEAERGIVLASQTAMSVATAQNGFTELAQAHHGQIPAADLASARQQLVPYFDPATRAASIGSWYIDRSDATSGSRTDRSVIWDAEGIPVLARDGSVLVHWSARDPDGDLRAWADAHFNITTQVLDRLQVHVTQTGADSQLEVH
ncbi:hypothetical protein [Acidipropionibacterium jensenii]|uniref:hypothetical protein n=1 Tax=Acidipropionibacterium jensenii TaxID=1749 RepID=UPI00214BC31B|nr:hypothetical protein [Acidipropionibacterium jensenii]